MKNSSLHRHFAAARRLTPCLLLLLACLTLDAEELRIEGKFGQVEIDPKKPALKSLTLRRADGTLEPHSLLSPQGFPVQRGLVPDWGAQAYTFAADEPGRRFESRNRPPESVEKTADGITLRGIVLSDGAGEPVAREDWTLKAEGDDLVWTVVRTWLREPSTTTTGTPCGYEGHLTYSYTFLQAVLLREPAFRERLYGNLRAK